MDKLQEKIMKSEGILCGLILKEPSLLNEYVINKKLLSQDALFYIGVTERLLSKGIENVDEVSFLTDIETVAPLLDIYNKSGGYKTIKDLMDIANTSNADAIVDEWNKWNLVKKYSEKGIFDIDKHFEKVVRMSSSQVVDYIEYQINDIDINVSSDIIFENLSYTNEDLQDLQDGVNIGVQYGSKSPLLNYLTLGVAKSNIYLYGGFTNSGKSSFIFENMILNMVEDKVKCCVISNEQKSDVFKVLLQEHILTEKLNYWKLTRKKIRMGKWNDEEKVMMDKAKEIAKRDYDPYLKFVKIYDYDTSKVNKIVKKLSNVGTEVFFYDTFKVGDSGSDAIWQKLLVDSKELFKTASRHNIAMILSVQLALAYKNKVRFLDESVLSNGKQIAEVVETGVYMRDLWEDEWNGEPHDIKPYNLKKDLNGKYTSDKEEVILDKNKKYKIMFLSKSRSDENGIAILYEFNGAFNKWHEIARCNPSAKNNY